MSWPKALLMVRPNGFRVEYAINPHMRDAEGRLHSVDFPKAMKQWEELQRAFTALGLRVEVLEGDPKFPDMVFCANQTFFYRGKNGRPRVILGKMRSEHRRGETEHFRRWATGRELAIDEMTEFHFEGCGDAIWNFATGEIFGGYGFRTDEAAYDRLNKLTGAPIHKLQLISEQFYHLDTCLMILNVGTAAYVPEAFTAEGLDVLRSRFKDLIAIDTEEAIKNFAANGLSVDGRHVVLQAGSARFVSQLKARGFQTVEVETSEFIKAGGSVFCMKQQITDILDSAIP